VATVLVLVFVILRVRVRVIESSRGSASDLLEMVCRLLP
jgi:hypothetical protein